MRIETRTGAVLMVRHSVSYPGKPLDHALEPLSSAEASSSPYGDPGEGTHRGGWPAEPANLPMGLLEGELSFGSEAQDDVLFRLEQDKDLPHGT